MATRDLSDEISNRFALADQFKSEQLQAIRAGADKIPDYTWHHHQDTGRMQLVPVEIHSAVPHVGWESMRVGK